MFYRTPSWLHGAALDRSQRGRWMLVCRVWNPTGRLTQKRRIAGWRKSAGQTRIPTFIPFSAHKCLKNVFLCVFLPVFTSYLSTFFFYPSLDSISLSLISPHPLNFSPEATVCVHPVAAATAGGHTSWWVNKRPRDPSSAEGWKIKFHFFSKEVVEGGGDAECAERGEKYEEVVEGGWMDGWRR